MIVQGHQDHLKRTLKFVQIGTLILKVSDVDFDFFFCRVHSKFFSCYVQTRLNAPYFFLKGLENVRDSIKLTTAGIITHHYSSAHSVFVSSLRLFSVHS